MLRKRFAVAGLTALVLGGGFSAYRRRRARKLHGFETVTRVNVKRQGLIRPMAILLIVMNATGVTHFGSTIFNKGSLWLGRISGFANAVLSIVGFITSPIVDMVAGVWDALGDVINSLGSVFDTFNDLIKNLLYTASWLKAQFEIFFDNWVLPVIEPLLNPIRTAISNLTGFLDDFWDNLYDIVGDIVGPIIDAAIDFALGGLADIANEIKKFLDDPVGYIWDKVSDLVQALIDLALDTLAFSASLAAQIVSLGLNTLMGTAEDVIDTLKKSWWFLVWVATHPEDAIEQLVESAIKEIAERSYKAIENTVKDNAPDVESLVARMLGMEL